MIEEMNQFDIRDFEHGKVVKDLVTLKGKRPSHVFYHKDRVEKLERDYKFLRAKIVTNDFDTFEEKGTAITELSKMCSEIEFLYAKEVEKQAEFKDSKKYADDVKGRTLAIKNNNDLSNEIFKDLVGEVKEFMERMKEKRQTYVDKSISYEYSEEHEFLGYTHMVQGRVDGEFMVSNMFNSHLNQVLKGAGAFYE